MGRLPVAAEPVKHETTKSFLNQKVLQPSFKIVHGFINAQPFTHHYIKPPDR